MTTPAAADRSGAAAGAPPTGGRGTGMKGFFSNLFGGGKVSSAGVAGGIPFGTNITVCKDSLSSGRYFAEGNHHEAFRDYWENHAQYEEHPANVDGLVYISARDIQGIHLYDSEVQDPAGFWGRRTGGTQNTFVDIAKQIPAVKSLADSGKSLQDICYEHPELESCVGIYFTGAPEVKQADGYYVFCDNGRHRSLAAQTINGMIPVRIRSIIKRRSG